MPDGRPQCLYHFPSLSATSVLFSISISQVRHSDRTYFSALTTPVTPALPAVITGLAKGAKASAIERRLCLFSE